MNEPLHIVDATMFWSPTGGGVRRYLQSKHAWLGAQPGWRHTLAVPRIAGSAPTAATLPSLPLPASGGYRLPLRRAAMADLLEALRPDLLEAGDPYRVAWAVRDTAQRRGVPAVAYCHSDLEAMARLVGGRWLGAAAADAIRRYLRHLYDGFDLVLAPSQSMVERLRGAGIDNVAWQPLGVDTAVFRPAPDRESWRAANGFATSDRVLVYAGRFAVEKHLDTLVAAVTKLGPPYHLVCIGAGPVAPARGARVRVLPFVADSVALARALSGADAFVHAGDQETFGLSVLEAMACATPAIVRAAGGLAETVDAQSGVAVEAASAAAFAAAIESLFAGDLGALRAGARARAEAYDWHSVLPRLLSHYATLLGRGERPSRSELPALHSTTAAGAAGVTPPPPSLPAAAAVR